MKHIFLITAELVDGQPRFEFDDDTVDQLLGGCAFDEDRGEYVPVPKSLNMDDRNLREHIKAALGI